MRNVYSIKIADVENKIGGSSGGHVHEYGNEHKRWRIPWTVGQPSASQELRFMELVTYSKTAYAYDFECCSHPKPGTRCHLTDAMEMSSHVDRYEGVSKSFRIGRLEPELQMVQLSATGCSYIVIL
jgi:hypothetical protein